jgi:hypothetical protein
MSQSERMAIYREIEAYRKRPLITYITSGRPGAAGNIASDGARIIAEQLKALPDGVSDLDLLINSFGGDGLASWRIVTMIREFLGPKGKITCLVPFYAFSAATLIAVGCNEIFMHPLATLGPVDPQIAAQTKDGLMQQFAYEDITAYVKFLREEAGLSEQSEKKSLLEPLVSQIAPSVIGGAKRASLQSKTMAERLLMLHMGKEDQQKAERIAEELSKNYFAHGHAVTRGEAEKLGLSIGGRDPKLEDLIWNVFIDCEDEMKMADTFDNTAALLTSPTGSALLQPPPIVNLPPSAPEPLVQSVWSQVLSEALKPGPQCTFDHEAAVIESLRRADTYHNEGKIIGCRMPDLSIKVISYWTNRGWRQTV